MCDCIKYRIDSFDIVKFKVFGVMETNESHSVKKDEPFVEAHSANLSKFEGGISKKRSYTASVSGMESNLEEMMYGFGDAWPPNPASVKMLMGIVENYVEDISNRAINTSEMRGKLDKECFLYVVRKERRLFNRAARLLKAHEELRSVQKESLTDELT
jgi:hypothetical protein